MGERTLDAPAPLDAAVARLAGRLAAVLDAVGGDAATVAFLRAHAAGAPPATAGDGTCLDLPRPGAPDPVHRLVGALRPDPAEVDLLVLAAAPHHHEGLAAVLRDLHPLRLPWPTVGLAGLLAQHGALGAAPPGSRGTVRALLLDGALAGAGVLTVDDTGPFSERSLVLPPLLWEALTGADRPWPAPVVPDRGPAPRTGLDTWLHFDAVRAAGAALEQDLPVTVLATAERPGAAAARLAALAGAAGRATAVLHVPVLDDRLVRHVLLLGLAAGVTPVLCSDRRPAGPLPADGLPVPLVVAVPAGTGPADPGPPTPVDTWPRPVLRVPTAPLDRRERHRMLAAALPGVELPRHPVGPATLEPRDVAVAAADLRAATALGGPPVDVAAVVAAIDDRAATAVPAGTVLVHPTATWCDLVLPDDRVRQLREAVDRVHARPTVFGRWGFLRGRAGRTGLRLLLCRPPGTGKTMAAEVLAGELGRDLLVVDLSRMVSKWIGETEKNLAAAFDCAERGGAVLLFDEADALFGRRTEVGDARDRYANLETAYLLSRLERFTGVAVLATNLRQNLDAAFARRIEFIVPFDPPDQAARTRLWRRHLPADAPVAPSVDPDRLAALYDLPGALIRNAAVAAAFLAAAEPDGRGTIGLHHVVHAIRREYAKAGRAFPGAPAGVPARPEPALGAPR
jgi:hypothetical protein